MSTAPINPSETSEDLKSREVRLGLVMYGGVSLAIYINGVAQEFYRAVRGRGIYKFVKALTDSDIVVDIISGTSAGGVNGILLAYALCNHKELSGTTNLWRIDGDIRRLLRSPYRGNDASRSLLNSEGYYQPRLEAAFSDMGDISLVDRVNELPSKFTELDLFITGTDVDGNISTQFDDAGHPIDVKDHRSVFLLKHRGGRKEPFNPHFSKNGGADSQVTYRALAKLSRITSCFPGAFAPVTVGDDQPCDDTSDGKLQMWGNLGKNSCFLDGGLIDNKPFTYTLREIFYRAANRQVDRKLFYVDPDPEQWKKLEKASEPNFAEAIAASLIGIPGYESISEDLKLLNAHNSKLNKYRRLVSYLDKQIALGREIEKSSPQVLEFYKRSRLISVSERVVQGVLRNKGRDALRDKQENQAERLAASALVEKFDQWHDDADQLSAAMMNKILSNFDVYYRLRRLFRTVYFILGEIERLDARGDTDDGTSGKIARYRKLWQALNTQIDLFDIIRSRMERLLDEAPLKWRDEEAEEIWLSVGSALHRLLDVNAPPALRLREFYERIFAENAERPLAEQAWLTHDDLSLYNRELRSLSETVVTAVGAGPLPVVDPPITALEQIEKFESKILQLLLLDADDPVRRAYEEFGRMDAKLFPVELIADLHEKDMIETIRISPRDAEKGFSKKSLADKVSGDALYHFGGFFKRSWRSNDILWGRLDTLCQLVETLLTKERLEHVINNPSLRRKIKARFFQNASSNTSEYEWREKMNPQQMFPHSGTGTYARCDEWFGQLLSEDENLRARALAETGEMIEHLIEAAQLEVIYEELPKVITDALEEQGRWNQFRVPRAAVERKKSRAKKDSEKSWVDSVLGNSDDGKPGTEAEDPFIFQSPDGNLDSFVAMLAAAAHRDQWMKRYESGGDAARPSHTKLGVFFKEDYKVGSERLLNDMPVLVLLEILSVSLLVLRNCVIGAFGDRGERVKSHPLYVILVDIPLRAFNALVLFLRRAPNTRKAVLIGLVLLSVLALVVGITWRGEIIYSGNDLNLKWFVVFAAAPFTILAAAYVYLTRERHGRIKWGRLARAAAIAVLTIAPFLLIPILFESIFDDGTKYIVARLAGWSRFLNLGLTENLRGTGTATWLARIFLSVTYFAAFIGPYIGIFWLQRFQRQRRADARDLRHALNRFFAADDMRELARRLDIKLNGASAPAEQDKGSLAARLISEAKRSDKLPRLEDEMISINPEALY